MDAAAAPTGPPEPPTLDASLDFSRAVGHCDELVRAARRRLPQEEKGHHHHRRRRRRRRAPQPDDEEEQSQLNARPHSPLNERVLERLLRTISTSLVARLPRHRDVDPLLCAHCEDLLRAPVTTACGHTFCRPCALTLRKCSRCAEELVGDAVSREDAEDLLPEKDVLVSRLVEKWWGAELRAEPRNADARLHLGAGQLDQALRSANESLEQGE